VFIHLAGNDAEDRLIVGKIVFHGQVWSVKTRVDGGIVVSLDLPENEIMQAAELMELKRAGAYLVFNAEMCNKDDKPEWTKST
jgi:hypothetical protein